jgi:pyrroline-5-carboxylate reductase
MRVGFIGAGHIAGALARGWAAAERRPELGFYDVVAERAAGLAAQTGGRVCATVDELVEVSDLVLVAVRPADVAAVLAVAGPRLEQRGLVSLAAGVEIDRLRAALPQGARVGRLMPNIAAEQGRGVFLLAVGTLAELAAPLRGALDAIGATVELDEALFDAGTAVSGCMPGYMGFIVEAFAEAGRRAGLEETTARLLAVTAAEGAVGKVAASGDPQAVMVATATPGGMTAAGLEALREAGVGEGIAAAVAAATARAKELA